MKEDIENAFRKVRQSAKIFIESMDQYLGAAAYHLDTLLDYAHGVTTHERNKVKVSLSRKHNLIFTESPWHKYSIQDNVFNISSIHLTSDQLCALGYGLSFALPPSTECILDFLSDFANFEIKLGASNVDTSTLKGFSIGNIICNQQSNNQLPKRLIDALVHLKIEVLW